MAGWSKKAHKTNEPPTDQTVLTIENSLFLSFFYNFFFLDLTPQLLFPFLFPLNRDAFTFLFVHMVSKSTSC